MSISRHSRVLIVGAGIGGLVTALSLYNSGFSNVVLLESAKEIKPLGLGINIQPEAVRVLCNLNLKDDLAKSGIATSALRYLDSEGELIWSQLFGIFAGRKYPQYSIHRGELQMILLSAVRRVLGVESVKTGFKVVDISQTSQEVSVRCRDRKTGVYCILKSDILIGADGINSVVRSKLHPSAEPIKWSSIALWRGVTLLDYFLDGQTMTITYDQNWSRLVTYPISKRHADNGKSLVNWVCLAPVGKSHLDYVTDWNRSGRLEDVLPYFSQWNLDWLDVRELLCKSQLILQYPMVDRDPLPFWVMGRIALLGDAAHLMYPTGSNGASQTILDADVLAVSLDLHNDIDTALASYERRRRDAAYKIVLANRRREREEWAIAAKPLDDKRILIKEIMKTYHDLTKDSRYTLS